MEAISIHEYARTHCDCRLAFSISLCTHIHIIYTMLYNDHDKHTFTHCASHQRRALTAQEFYARKEIHNPLQFDAIQLVVDADEQTTASTPIAVFRKRLVRRSTNPNEPHLHMTVTGLAFVFLHTTLNFSIMVHKDEAEPGHPLANQLV